MDVTKDPNYPATPELDKLLGAVDTYNTIAMFLDWAADEKVVYLADAPKIIGEFLGVDMDAVENERAAILEYLQVQYPTVPPPPVTMEVTVGDDKEVIEFD